VRPRAEAPFALVLERRAALGLYAVDLAAEQAGLRPGMALADARAMTPSLHVAPATPGEDAAALARLADWCGRYSPWTAAGQPDTDPHGQDPAVAGDDPFQSLEGAGGGGLWLDATGCAHLFGGEDAMLEDLVARVRGRGFSARAAMADTPGAAWAMARFAPGGAPWVAVPPGGAADALAPLPVAALRLGAATAAGLHGLGIRRVADLADLPRAPLAARFGETVAARLDAALGRRTETISPERPRPPLAARLAFPEPLGRAEDIAAALDALLAELCRALEDAGKGVRRLTLVLYRPDGSLARCAVGTARPNRDPVHLARLFAERIGDIDPGFGIEEMMLAAAVAEPLAADQLGLERDAPGGGADPAALEALIDRLANRLGAAAVRRTVFRESHLPERAAGFRPAGDGPGPGAVPAPPGGPRPVCLLRPPEPIEALCGAPDGPPAQFRWRRVLHRVARIEGPERIAPEWWRAAPGGDDEESCAAGTRDYYRAEDTDGRRFWLYREAAAPAPPGWYLHGLFG